MGNNIEVDKKEAVTDLDRTKWSIEDTDKNKLLDKISEIVYKMTTMTSWKKASSDPEFRAIYDRQRRLEKKKHGD